MTSKNESYLKQQEAFNYAKPTRGGGMPGEFDQEDEEDKIDIHYDKGFGPQAKKNQKNKQKQKDEEARKQK